ncbi:hypothetical protein SZN_19345 [Streptomyces zinciresistens K42]|uniref:Lipoprotein n=1 Tax=Streptomyces zinciresistens K42 TaxID=700597 RepID=G2GED6_9ACTN|nr:hypothetical protein SZN_19345 [Streptomyces zinciresistens K42]
MFRSMAATAAALCAIAAGAVLAPPAPPARAAPAAIQVPAGVEAGAAVFDRRTGTFTEEYRTSSRFRSASVVKLLLALDFLWNRGPAYAVPAADRARLEPMLRSSDDDAASYYWSRNGGSAIITRMARELGLPDTQPPPPGYEGYWGYTSLSARDTVTIYRYLLDTAPGPVRDFVMGNLRASTRCASDGFDQHFGVAGAFAEPWAVKQGWSGAFGAGTCTAAQPRTAKAPRAAAAAPAAETDLTRPALHSTGTVGPDDRYIVAVYTLHQTGTAYGKAYTDIGRLTRSLNVPDAARPAGRWYGTWSENVNVRPDPSTTRPPLTRLPAGVEVLVGCQKQGQRVDAPPYSNDWWAYLPQYGGWISNIYISSPGNRLPDVGNC